MKPYTIQNQHSPHFLTWTTVEWIDIFTRQRYRDIVIDSLKYCIEHKGLFLYAYVIMSNHVHLIACADRNFRLSDIVRDCKKFTCKAVVDSIHDLPESRRSWLDAITHTHGILNRHNSLYKLWQEDSHAIELTDLRRFYQKLAYIHQNPVKAGIVVSPEHYLYSSARNYAGLKGLIDVKLMDIVPLDGYMPPM